MPKQLLLRGRAYLIVEDEYLAASSMAMTLEEMGAGVFGPVSDLERAMDISKDPAFAVDAAILDVNLRGEMVYPFAEILVERGLPFVFITGTAARAFFPGELAEDRGG